MVGTIYSRFTKKLPDGLAMCGVFTRDYRYDVMNSQVYFYVCFNTIIMTSVFHLASENVNLNYKNCAITNCKVQEKSKHTFTSYQMLAVYGIQPYLSILRAYAVDYLLWLKAKTLKVFGCQHTADALQKSR